MKRWNWLWWLLGVGAVGGVAAFVWSRRVSAQTQMLSTSSSNPLVGKFCVRWSNLRARLAERGVEDYLSLSSPADSDLVYIEFDGAQARYTVAHADGTVYESGAAQPTGADRDTVLMQIHGAYTDAGQRGLIQCVPGHL